MGDHASWPGAITGNCAVGNSEDARVNFFLDRQEINQGFVDD